MQDQALGEQYAALCMAASTGERIRNAGGSALVVLDSLESMVQLWERMNSEEARLGPAPTSRDADDGTLLLRIAVLPVHPCSVSACCNQLTALCAISSCSLTLLSFADTSAEALVQWEGMLVSAAAAQRRQFFSSLVQRAAKMHRRLGGGAMSLLMLLHGSPATGDTTAATRPPSATISYKHLTDAQRTKLEAALAAKAAAAGGAVAGTALPLHLHRLCNCSAAMGQR